MVIRSVGRVFPSWDMIHEPSYTYRLQPELVIGARVADVKAYRRFNDAAEKQAFRAELNNVLHASVRAAVDSKEEADDLIEVMSSLLQIIDERGALMLERVVESGEFAGLVDLYDSMINAEGNSTFLHNFVDVRSHPEILLDSNVNESFLHPLFIAIISNRVGGPVRLVDVRAKDAEPISVLAQDNMLHIDNTPFNDEYKVLLTWGRGTTRGPNGQNFTYLPGTHKLARQCQVDSRGAWSSENCSIFTTPDSVTAVLNGQMEVTGLSRPVIIEVAGCEYPVSTVFPAGSLVHHRFRTSSGQSRSCIIAAFHRVKDNPGSLIAHSGNGAGLADLLVGHGTVNEEVFLSALTRESVRIVELLRRVASKRTRELTAAQVEMSEERFADWFSAVTSAPAVSDLRLRGVSVVGDAPAKGELRMALSRRVMFDKHGPIDLVLYADNHEEVRKWARNSLRELTAGAVSRIVDDRFDASHKVTTEDVLSPDRTIAAMSHLVALFEQVDSQALDIDSVKYLPTIQSVDREMVRDSIAQFGRDLCQAMMRTDGRECFRSTSLFIALTSDLISRLGRIGAPEVAQLWRQYVVFAFAD